MNEPPYRALAGRLTAALALATPPTAVRFEHQAPGEGERPEQAPPAGCGFWSTTRRVVTGAPDHRFCAIGIHTHNLEGSPPAQGQELQDALAAMMGLDYVRESEVAEIPVMASPARYVAYEPLADSSRPPDLALVFAPASQSLIITEALARVDGVVPPAMGRPACALVPQVTRGGAAAMSLGCCGARAYLDAMTDDVSVWGLPGAKLEAYVDAIETFAEANRTLAVFHQRRRSDIEAGGAPTVAESLARLKG